MGVSTMKNSMAVLLWAALGGLGLFAEVKIHHLNGESSTWSKGFEIREGDLLVSSSKASEVQVAGVSVTLGEKSSISLERLDFPKVQAVLEHYEGGLKISSDGPVHVRAGVVLVRLIDGELEMMKSSRKLTVSLTKGLADVVGKDKIHRLKAGEGVSLKDGRLWTLELPESSEEDSWSKVEFRDKAHADVPTFAQRLQELGQLKEVKAQGVQGLIREYSKALKLNGWLDLLEKGREQLMAQQLLSLVEAVPILPEDMERHVADRAGFIPLKKDLNILDAALSKMTPADQNTVSFFVRQQMAEQLISKKRVDVALSGFWRSTVRHHSNVTEAPEDQQGVSGESGMAWTNNFKMSWAGRKRDWGSPSVDFRVGDRTFFDDQFQTREYTSVGLKFKNVIERKGKKNRIQKITPSFEIRGDYVNRVDGRDLNNTTYAPAVDLVFAPVKGWGEYSDLFFSFMNLSYSLRAYESGFDVGRLGDDKDASTLGLTWIGVNIDRFRDWRVTETVVLGYRTITSDDEDLEYDAMSLDLSAAFRQGLWEVKPSVAYRSRSQDNYLGASRDDDRFEAGLSFTRNFPFLEGATGFRIVDQDSSQDALNYVDRQWSLGFTKKF